MTKIYVIWNLKQDRPVIMGSQYGSMVVYLTHEQAAAYVTSQTDERFGIVEMEVTSIK